MDLQIELECRKCGFGFSQEFKEVQIGKTLRCPSCSACSLMLAGEDSMLFQTDDEQRFVS